MGVKQCDAAECGRSVSSGPSSSDGLVQLNVSKSAPFLLLLVKSSDWAPAAQAPCLPVPYPRPRRMLVPFEPETSVIKIAIGRGWCLHWTLYIVRPLRRMV